MQIRVLGSAAGGGFPQWNCNCPNCDGLRRGTINAHSRTQSSIALSADGTDWLLINASPDIRAQLAAFPAMQPARGLRDTGIKAVLLMDSQIDHSSGLLMLREHAAPLTIYCTQRVQEDLVTGLPLLRVLEHYCGVDVQTIPINGALFQTAGMGINLTAVPLTSKAPPYSPHRADPHPGDNIGLWMEDASSGKTAFYAPGLGEIEAHLWPYLQRADCLLVDGSFWSEYEMQETGVGKKAAADMGHLPQSGPNGMLAQFKQLPDNRKILIHINNTNPILIEDSPQRAELARRGVEVAFDGMDITL